MEAVRPDGRPGTPPGIESELRQVRDGDLIQLQSGALRHARYTPQHITQLLGQSLQVQRLPLIQVLPHVCKNLACLLRDPRRRVEESLLGGQPRVQGTSGGLLVIVKRHGKLA